MKAKLVEHITSILLVSAILLTLVVVAGARRESGEKRVRADTKDFVNLPFVDYGDPFHRALFRDVLNIYFPGQEAKNAGILAEAERFRQDQLGRNLDKEFVLETLSWAKFWQLFGMYVKFVVVYVVVMLLTYYGVQTLGAWRFVRRKQRGQAAGGRRGAGAVALGILKTLGQGIAALILFSPSYVLAYAIRTDFNTDTMLFMVLLAVTSNGLLILYSNKFYAFLVSESRKGYVETAVVKNLHASYAFNTPDGIPYKAVFRPIKQFGGHVFSHIFRNAHNQYLSTIKEQASFLITGLIIIEMALNIHGHLCYEMLRQILYRNFDIVLVIVLGIFYTVKFTEIFTDWAVYREARKYENR